MPVTAFGPSFAAGPGQGTSRLPGSAAAPAAAAPLAAMPTGGVVGHGVTR
ncbi:MAG: hypothetical protein QOJ35_4146, partial [Solirubrobacteraceae bacterium]|nr:hypothetical protein [Solirubrobacteraceae bacterium]